MWTSQRLTIKTIKWTMNHHNIKRTEHDNTSTTLNGHRGKAAVPTRHKSQRLDLANLFKQHRDDKPARVVPAGDLDRCRPRMPPTSRRRTCCINRRSCPVHRNAQRDDPWRTPPGLSRRVVGVHRDDGRVRAEQARGALFCGNGRNGIRVTSTATIDATGMGDCFLVCWSSDRAVLEASIKRAMKSYDDVGVQAVFCFDSDSIPGLSTG